MGECYEIFALRVFLNQSYCCIHATKGVERKVSTMYFYKTAYRQYVHSGSDTHIHSLFFFLSSSGQASVSLTL